MKSAARVAAAANDAQRKEAKATLVRCLGDKPDAEQRHLRLVQKLHAPFGVLLHISRNAANKVATDLGHLSPCSVLVWQINAVIGHARVIAVTNLEKEQRHLKVHFSKAVIGLGELLRQSGQNREFGDRKTADYEVGYEQRVRFDRESILGLRKDLRLQDFGARAGRTKLKPFRGRYFTSAF
jgi:hypothetical protein